MADRPAGAPAGEPAPDPAATSLVRSSASLEGFRILEWDSGVFGFPVASLQVSNEPALLERSLEAARAAGVRLAYLITAGTDNHFATAAERANGTALGERLTFVTRLGRLADDLSSKPPIAPVVERWMGTVATPALRSLALDAGRYSRFFIDPRVDRHVATRIYDLWIERSLTGQIADEVMVVTSGRQIDGVVTVGTRGHRSEIGLLAVREDARGRGVGKALVRAALQHAQGQGFDEAQVVTQGANVAARRLYEHCGYAVERVEYVYHFWL